jgi:tRNA(fMet)-specific endonuclease VapC
MMKPTDTRGEIYRRRVQKKNLCVCFVTVGELLFGAYKGNWSETKIDKMKARLRSVVIVPYDYLVCQTYANLKVDLRQQSLSVADNDLWIAACAVRHSIPLVTNNRKHFDKIPGLIVISEAPVIQEIKSQEEFQYGASGSTETEQPSSQSPSPELEKGQRP